ncbi:MAG: hypothetical protein V5A62_03150 [Haloarculaceae archaeon]
MLRRVLEWFAGRFGTDEDSGADEAGSGFVPSPLDRSVRYAYGGNDDGERELANVRERAEAFEEQRRNGRSRSDRYYSSGVET